MLGDLRDPRWMYVKAAMFLCIGGTSVALILIDSPSWRTAALLAAVIWAFCRAYYFAFYVVEKYADPGFTFSGLFSFARYVLQKRGRPRGRDDPSYARRPQRGQ